jgi:hypothetical protein
MTGLDIFALIVLLVLVGTVLYLVVFLARWPGQIAENRAHPQTDAIRVAGWLGILTFGILWPLAFIWAHTRPLGEVGK